MEDDKQLNSPASNGSLNQEDFSEKLTESLEKVLVSLEDKVGELVEQIMSTATITAPLPVLSTHESLDTSESLTGETTPSEIADHLGPPIVNDVDAGPFKVEQNLLQEKVNDGGHDHTLEEISMDEKDSPDDMDMEFEEGELLEGDESAGENVEGEGEAPGASEKKFYKYSKEEFMELSKKFNKALIESLPADLRQRGQQMNPTMGMKKVKGGGKRNNVPPPQPQKHPLSNDEIVFQTVKILNQLIPDNFDKLVNEFMKLPLEDNDERISSVIRVVFDKAVDEPSFSATYAKMVNKICSQRQETSKIFRKKILDICQKEFQKNSSDEDEIKEAELELENAEESKKDILKIDLEEKKNQLRKRSSGMVRFIGELYKLGMLNPRIMMECVGMLLCMDEEKLECLCKLLTTVGQKLEGQIRDLEAMIAQKKKSGGDVFFEPEPRWFDKTFAKLRELSLNEALSLRIRSALEDVHKLRGNNWKPRTNAPKTKDKVRQGPAREDQEKKRLIFPLPNIPPQQRGDVKKPLDWNVVSSNKSPLQQQQTPSKRGDEANSGQSSPVLGPPATQWGPQPPFGKVSQPPTNVPPGYQPGRFGLWEKRTPSREDIVKPSPTSNNTTKKSQPLPTSNIPSLFANKTPPKGWTKNQSPSTPPLGINASISSSERHSTPNPAGKLEIDPSQIPEKGKDQNVLELGLNNWNAPTFSESFFPLEEEPGKIILKLFNPEPGENVKLEDDGKAKGEAENLPSKMEGDKHLYSPVSYGSLNQEDLKSPEKLAESEISMDDKDSPDDDMELEGSELSEGEFVEGEGARGASCPKKSYKDSLEDSLEELEKLSRNLGNFQIPSSDMMKGRQTPLQNQKFGPDGQLMNRMMGGGGGIQNNLQINPQQPNPHQTVQQHGIGGPLQQHFVPQHFQQQPQRPVYQYPQIPSPTGQMPMIVGYPGQIQPYAQIPQVHTSHQNHARNMPQMYTLPYGMQYPQPFQTNVVQHAQPGLPIHAGEAQPLYYPQYQPPTNDEIVKNISKEFFYTQNFDDTIEEIKKKVPGDEIGVFIELFSRKIAENSKADQQKLGGSLVKSLLARGLVSKERVMESIMKGVISNLPNILLNAPMAVSYLATFLIEIFSEEKEDQVLKYLGKHQSILTKLMASVEEKLNKELP